MFWCRLVGEEDGCCSASEELGLGTISLKRGRGWSGDPGLLSFPAFSPAGVGKSSLLLRFADNTFSGECAAGMLPGVLVLTSLPLAPEHPGLCLTSEKFLILIARQGRRRRGRRLEVSVVGLHLSCSKKSSCRPILFLLRVFFVS